MRPELIRNHNWQENGKDHTCSKCGITYYNLLSRDGSFSNPYPPVCAATDTLKKDTIIRVRPWWTKEVSVQCRVSYLYKDYLVVIPLTGNPHTRMIRYSSILS